VKKSTIVGLILAIVVFAVGAGFTYLVMSSENAANQKKITKVNSKNP